ncbi:MAG: YicC family protein [Bdellovibrionaceae bacterium]|nr:YicC family protein [Pseudobdellovibrionaceae bacterium]
MKSMTGFGTDRAQTADVTIEVSLRTVNGRFLEPRFHLPREFMPFESDLRKILTEKIKRGTVDVFINRRVRTQKKNKLAVNKDLARQYVDAYRSLGRDLKLPSDLHLEVIARLPEIIKIEETQEPDPKEKTLLLKTFKGAVEACVKERMREGKALKNDLGKLLASLEKRITEIMGLREEANAQLQERFETRLASRMKNGGEMDPQRVLQEIVLQLDKADINEELQRLAEHTKNYRQMLQVPDPEGKKLDFYTQELLREVNTIGSKSQVAKITHSVVEAKTLIERLREQVQNVE